MIELLFVTCLHLSPTDCQERSLVFTGITPQICMQGAQPELAKWIATHPNERITRWSCQYVQTAEQDV